MEKKGRPSGTCSLQGELSPGTPSKKLHDQKKGAKEWNAVKNTTTGQGRTLLGVHRPKRGEGLNLKGKRGTLASIPRLFQAEGGGG